MSKSSDQVILATASFGWINKTFSLDFYFIKVNLKRGNDYQVQQFFNDNDDDRTVSLPIIVFLQTVFGAEKSIFEPKKQKNIIENIIGKCSWQFLQLYVVFDCFFAFFCLFELDNAYPLPQWRRLGQNMWNLDAIFLIFCFTSMQFQWNLKRRAFNVVSSLLSASPDFHFFCLKDLFVQKFEHVFSRGRSPYYLFYFTEHVLYCMLEVHAREILSLLFIFPFLAWFLLCSCFVYFILPFPCVLFVPYSMAYVSFFVDVFQCPQLHHLHY